MQHSTEFQINVAGVSDIGQVRTENEDYFLSYNNKEWPFAYIIVADGMGGYSGGALASKITAQVIDERLKNIPDPTFVNANKNQQLTHLRDIVEQSITEANQAVLNEKVANPHFSQMGTTVVLALIWRDLLVVANVGDSRAYVWESSRLQLKSKDHSLVQELIDSGAITADDARQHQYRNQLTRAIGVEREVSAEIYSQELERDTMLLLCSDGLTEYIDEQELAIELDSKRPLLEHCYRMIEIANKEGGKDNITVAFAEFTYTESD